MARSKGEEAFMDQEVRRLTVEWARRQIQGDEIIILGRERDYVPLALEKGYLTKATPHQVTSSGFSTAASFLKR